MTRSGHSRLRVFHSAVIQQLGDLLVHRAWVSHVRSVTVALGVAGALERPGEACFASRVLGDLDAFMSFQERADGLVSALTEALLVDGVGLEVVVLDLAGGRMHQDVWPSSSSCLDLQNRKNACQRSCRHRLRTFQSSCP